MKIKIAIADDHPLLLNGLNAVITKTPDMELTGSYENGSALLEDLPNNQPDILLLDIQMPGQTGDEIAGIVNYKYPHINIIALTNQDNIYYINTMFRKGVKGYLLKTTHEDILLNAIRTVYQGEEFLDEALKERVKLDSLNSKKEGTQPHNLTRREKEILQLMATNLTSQQIAEKLYLSVRTVENVRSGLMTKLDAKNAATLVKKAIQLGLIE